MASGRGGSDSLSSDSGFLSSGAVSGQTSGQSSGQASEDAPKRKLINDNGSKPKNLPKLKAKQVLQHEISSDIGENEDGWQEPELAAPQPIVTGFPLGSFPSKKIKKEALWPRKKLNSSNKKKLNKKAIGVIQSQNRNKDINNNSEENSPHESAEMELDDDEDFEEEINDVGDNDKRLKYDKNLQTKKSEELANLSLERKELHPKIKNDSDLYRKKKIKRTIDNSENIKIDKKRKYKKKNSIPSTPSKNKGNGINGHGNKRIKYSPKKIRQNPFGYGGPPDLAGQPRFGANNNANYDDPTKVSIYIVF
ncbi:hypothetical protein PACTADRAFT_5411 [Pachysolen tannophilus NRRL Y-2460]|uniref:Uncharacterized protein n=1 Tax=Pachysolen tannophilus NRRL Y-2460 TaxID=669874 RepID=A0A1E4TMQ8_PACTA|nr:hypothetical protein PACTADRAFT_5411 [Pachysolen tannophilus NRRL Y-2460]